MEYYMDDEKWKMSRSVSQSSSSKPQLQKSFSHKNPFGLSRSSSQKNTKSSLPRSSSQRCSDFSRKCSSLAKEQKAKFYIVKRCIKMLVSWKKNGSDS